MPPAAGLEVLHLAAGLVAAGAWTGEQRLDIGWTLSTTRLLLIPLLFILARVFGEGARMRDDLATTI